MPRAYDVAGVGPSGGFVGGVGMLHHRCRRADRGEGGASRSHAGEADLAGLLVDPPLVAQGVEESQLPFHVISLPGGCDNQGSRGLVVGHITFRDL